MPTLIDRRGRRDDLWADPAAASGPRRDPAGDAPNSYRYLLLPLADWLTRRTELLAEIQAAGGATVARLKLGVELGPADDPSQIAEDLASLTLIAIQFPRFTDGRGYSLAVELRRAGFAGEMRAVGEVLIDQVFLMKRVGFTQFALRADQDRTLAVAALTRHSEAYQGGADQPLPAYRRHLRPVAA